MCYCDSFSSVLPYVVWHYWGLRWMYCRWSQNLCNSVEDVLRHASPLCRVHRMTAASDAVNQLVQKHQLTVLFQRIHRLHTTPGTRSQWVPLPSNRHHRSSGDCLEGKRENYQVCSVQYCVQQLYTMQCTHVWTDLTVLWIGFCLTGPISLCLVSFLCMYYLVGLKPILRTSTSFSALTLLVGSFDP